jgi:hypothetical protein
MSVNRLADYLDHMEQAATDACSFVEGLSKEEFLVGKRTQPSAMMRTMKNEMTEGRGPNDLRRSDSSALAIRCNCMTGARLAP